MKTMKTLFINIIIAVSIITAITQSAEFVNATMDNTDTITCQHGDGTTMGGTFHFAGNCQGANQRSDRIVTASWRGST